MNLLFHIVYAGHASGTHHKLALDALRHLNCMDADLWQRTIRRCGGSRLSHQLVKGLIKSLQRWDGRAVMAFEPHYAASS